MNIWLNMILENNLYKAAQPASTDQIDNAEKTLGLVFAADYREFLSSVGACICFGHEINGIAVSKNLDVIKATEEIRNLIDTVPHSWYVIEDTHIDSIVILQDKNGTVYQMAPDMMPMKIAYSLESYLSEPLAGLRNRPLSRALDNGQSSQKTDIDQAAQAALNKTYVQAERTLQDPDQVEKVLQQMEKKLETLPGIGDWLADVPAVISLIRSYIRKEYRNIPAGSIVAALAAILYVVAPIDLIPDLIPGVGMLDDAAVFVLCWKMIHDDVDKYQAWRKQTGRDIAEK